MKPPRSVRVQRKSLLTGTREAEGVAVVIDVLRAFTSAAVMFYLGADKIILLAEPEEALSLKRDNNKLGGDRSYFMNIQKRRNARTY